MQGKAEAAKTELIVGTYNRLGGRGLVGLTVDDDRLVVGTPRSETGDASYAIRSVRHGCFYAVIERPEGAVRTLAVEGEELRCLSVAATGGAAPCHLALDPAEQVLAVANYESGSVALYRLDAAGGVPDQPTAFIQLAGRSADPERQAGSHAHWVGFEKSGKRMYVVDLGTDHVWVFDVEDALAGTPTPAIAFDAPAGSGPRHLVFDAAQPLAYLVSELASTLTVLSVGPDGGLKPVRTISTLPTDAGESGAGAIVMNAARDRLYVTNRGHDSVAVIAVDGTTLTPIEHVPSGGASPRFLLLLEEQRKLLVANEEGGSIRLFAIADDGRLSCRDTVNIPGAAFVAPLK